jgi:ArsR family transcriptional regulator
MEEFTSAFKALSDLTRLRALRMLLTAGEPLCVCELTDALELPQYQVSKHLAILRQVGLVKDTRVGTWAFYSVPEEAPAFAAGLYDLVRRHVDGPIFRQDAERLRASLVHREEGRCVLGPEKAASAKKAVRTSRYGRRSSRE